MALGSLCEQRAGLLQEEVPAGGWKGPLTRLGSAVSWPVRPGKTLMQLHEVSHAGPWLMAMRHGLGTCWGYTSGGRAVPPLTLPCPPSPALPSLASSPPSIKEHGASAACRDLGWSLWVIEGEGDTAPALRDLTASRRRHHSTTLCSGGRPHWVRMLTAAMD